MQAIYVFKLSETPQEAVFVSMIDKAIDFLAKEINAYAKANLADFSSSTFCQTKNLSELEDTVWDGPVNFSLIHIEEDRVVKSQEAYYRQDDKVYRANPKIPINMYCMFSVKKPSDYITALSYLSSVIRFFQYNNVFVPAQYKNLDPGIEKLIADIYNLTLEQHNQFWSFNGAKYYPSIAYKIRMVEIDSGPKSEAGLVTEINIGEN